MPDDELRPLIRARKPEDDNLILSSWLQSYRDAPDVVALPHSTYYSVVKGEILALLNTRLILVAAYPDDTDQVLGWIVAEKDAPLMHYVYVKHLWRRFGVARQLVDAWRAIACPKATQFECSFATRVYHRLREKHHLVYDPFRRTNHDQASAA